MIYHSTRNEQLTASSTHAVLQGIAPDGGLYICDPAALRFDWRAALEKDTLSMAMDEIEDGDITYNADRYEEALGHKAGIKE